MYFASRNAPVSKIVYKTGCGVDKKGGKAAQFAASLWLLIMLEHFFEPHLPGATGCSTSAGSLGSRIISAHSPDFVMPQHAVVLFSVGANDPAWRRALYALSDWETRVPIIDLGLFKYTPQAANNLQGLKQVLQLLNEKQAMVCAIDHSNLLPAAQWECLQQAPNPSEWCCISPNLEPDVLQCALETLEQNRSLPWCLRFNRIANQEFYVKTRDYKTWQQVLCDDLSVGSFREDPTRAEPLLRNAHSVSFFLDALKATEYGDPARHNPSGLHSEEACKIMWYAGMSNHLQNMVLAHLGSTPISLHTAELLAQMTWYFCKAATLKPKDMPDENNPEFTLIRCPATDLSPDEELVFLLNSDTQRVWIQMERMGKNYWMACHYNDLALAQEGVVPNLWFHNLKLP